MVGRAGFAPAKAMPADLQSAPVGYFGTDPFLNFKITTGDFYLTTNT